MDTKKCKECCEIKKLSEFYRAGNERRWYQSRCKPCHILNRKKYKSKAVPWSEYKLKYYKYEKKGSGFDRLPEDVKHKLIYMKQNGYSHKEIACACGIKYQTYYKWVKNNKIPENYLQTI